MRRARRAKPVRRLAPWINDEAAAVFKKREKLRKNGIPVKMVKY